VAGKVRQGRPRLGVDQVLADGSSRSRLGVVSDRSHQRRREPITVRVIEYTLADPGWRSRTDRYRLVTTILDPDLAPAGELAALYTERWELETTAARWFFQRAIGATKVTPVEVVTDLAPTYPAVLEDLLPVAGIAPINTPTIALRRTMGA
jgi:hypothetical protein